MICPVEILHYVKNWYENLVLQTTCASISRYEFSIFTRSFLYGLKKQDIVQ